ncbi:chemotaxis protein CheB [Mitsuokella sp. oral taxon 131]|uniref:chemotaxis protein CheB n=1 Tax=Mitsuokella sp. oral taxon 131 TaxID=1321780 RepID=UPI0003AD90AD|nr:chemotaxis protein CheB [Mitsuokella sp. oral taxon 131]ERL05392.1 glutamate methylesterase domain protein [Mitsuokella sp. oral taxon 131 str. W9106]
MSGLRVLIVDGSPLERDRLVRELSTRLASGTLVEAAASVDEVQEKLRLFHPTVVLLSFASAATSVHDACSLPRLIEESRVPIITYGRLETSREAALSMGVFDYLHNPGDERGRASFYRLLIAAIKRASEAEHVRPFASLRPLAPPRPFPAPRDAEPAQRDAEPSPPSPAPVSPFVIPAVRPAIPMASRPAHPSLIAIGASTGGPDALSRVLVKLTTPMPPIVIVQHIPATFSGLFAKRLNGECALHIKEAETGDILRPDTVYIAPGGKHMTVQKKGNALCLVCEKGVPRHNVCPSADVLFESVAETVGAAAAGVILTGMGRDGAAGLLKMRQAGAPTIGQDEASSVVYGMPRAAYEIGAVERQCPLEEIATAITRLVR